MIAIVDYGMGNLLSVHNALRMVGADPRVCQKAEDIASADRVVVPGVGAFGDAMLNLRSSGLVEALNAAKGSGKPMLGICLGMQIMGRRGFEFGEHAGLDWFRADVVKIRPADTTFRVPQIGWNNLTLHRRHPVLAGIPENADFYFVHSFHLVCEDASDLVASCDYAQQVTAAVGRDNVFATQFHPEKSQEYGLKLLENFVKWSP